MDKSAAFVPLLGPPPPTMKLLISRLEEFGYRFIDCFTPEMIEAADIPVTPPIALAPLSSPIDAEAFAKTVEALRLRFKDIYVIGGTTNRQRQQTDGLFRAGVQEVYQSPFEDEFLINKFFEFAPIYFEPKELTLDQLMRVNILDIERVEKLDFEVFVFLPLNQRAILYLDKNQPVDERIVKKFKENPHYNLYIRRADLSQYLEFCRHVIRADGEPAVQEKDRARHVSEKIAGLMGGFFSDDAITEDDGRVLLDNMKTLLQGLEDQSGSKKNIVASVNRYASQRLTHYTHAHNVATYCAIFGLAAGINEPETLRMGGLLHDLGLADLPSLLLEKDLNEMCEDDAAQYKLHPGGGKFSVERQKLGVPKEVIDMILLHHEHADGSGYPYGKTTDEIPPMAKICALADVFDRLTSVRTGHRQLSPAAAMRRIAGLDGQPPEPVFDPSFHQPIIDRFMTDLMGSTEVFEQAEDTSAANEPITRPETSGSSAGIVSFGDLLTLDRYQYLRPAPAKITSDDTADSLEVNEIARNLDSYFLSKRGL
jgi:HD-GYP domain-containing protein (c-di-GMP phosphodiesterase class II)